MKRLLWLIISLLALAGCAVDNLSESALQDKSLEQIVTSDGIVSEKAIALSSAQIERNTDAVIIRYQTDVPARMAGYYCSGDLCAAITGGCSLEHLITLPRAAGVDQYDVTVTFSNDCADPVTKEFCVDITK